MSAIHDTNEPCWCCKEVPAFDQHYGIEFGLCSRCAEAIANVWWKAHSGSYLTWPEDAEPAKPPSKKPVAQKVRWQVLKAAGFACQRCGTDDEPMHVDHIVPRARGGGNEDENLQALCYRCNIAKGAK